MEKDHTQSNKLIANNTGPRTPEPSMEELFVFSHKTVVVVVVVIGHVVRKGLREEEG